MLLDVSAMSFLALWKERKRKAVQALREKGVAATIILTVTLCKRLALQRWKVYFIWNPWNPWYCYLDKRFDRRFGVDTAGVLILPEIHSDPQFRGYSPTPHSRFFRLLRQIDVDYTRFIFVDFGCGKGKAVLLAAEFPFKRILGIELSPELVRIAEDNLIGYRGNRRCKTIQLVCTDAREFRLPEEPTLCYFWDPFEAEVMRKVLENIRRSLAAAPREVYILYFMPMHRNLLDESGFLAPVKQTSWYCIYRASGPFCHPSVKP